MTNKRTIILTIHLIVNLCFLNFSLSMSQAEVTLSAEIGTGVPGSYGNSVSITLENLDDKVRAIEMLIEDVDDYLVFTGCETTERSAGFECLGNEITKAPELFEPDLRGFCKIILLDMEGETLIEQGTGPICKITFQVKTSAPLGECRDLNLIEELEGRVYTKASNEVGNELALVARSGKFCFNGSETTTTTAINGTSTTTTITSNSTTTVIIDTSTTTTTTTDISIEVIPIEVRRSRWIPLFWLMHIKGENTNFDQTTRVTYDEAESALSVIPLPRLVLPPKDIWQIIIIMPSILTGIGFEGESETVTVTVDGASDTFEIKMLSKPFDERKNLM